MRSERVDEVLLVRYLLGNLTEEEQTRVEDRAFAEIDYFGAMEAAEVDLIDSYVRGELSQVDRRAFERRFLTSPARLSKVEFARALARVAAESEEDVTAARRASAGTSVVSLFRGWSPALQFAACLAAVMVIAGLTWVVMQNGVMRSRVTALEAARRDLEIKGQSLQTQLGEEQRRSADFAGQLQQQRRPCETENAVRVPVVAH